jgi:NAD(P)-dependent dehydrogenase (short-subunit alcohol dehydrogenase family)
VDVELDGARQTVGGGDRAVALACDVSDEGSVESTFDAAETAFGAELDVVVNVAGIGSTETAAEETLARWEQVFAVNARGTFLVAREAVRRLKRCGRAGVIVNVASVAAQVGLRKRAAYCASKGAVVALTRAMAVDHAADGIRVNCVCPGTIRTPWVQRLIDDAGEAIEDLEARQLMGRLGEPEDVAELILFLASDRSRFATGAVFVLDGGLSAA